MDDWQLLNEYKHLLGTIFINYTIIKYILLGIVHLYADTTGTKLVIIDDKCDAFLFNSVNDVLIELPIVSPSVVNVVWESFIADKVSYACTFNTISKIIIFPQYIFIASDRNQITTFVYYRDTIKGIAI